MTHASVPKEQRATLGITDNFLRLSVGIENVEDLIDDINQALVKAVTNRFISNKFKAFLLIDILLRFEDTKDLNF